MILTFDIGNTRTSIALFDEATFTCVREFHLLSEDLYSNKKLVNLLSTYTSAVKIDGAVIGSVVEEVNDGVCAVLREFYQVEPVVISSKSRLPIQIGVEFPEKLGVDRIVNGAYAYDKYKDAVIVVDCGSAITFDIVNKDGVFVGGIISLGLRNQLKAISSSTSALPELDLREVNSVIGNNTQKAILSGVVNGTASMIDGMIEKTKSELGCSAKVILTGGDSELIGKYLNANIDEINSKFTLFGLNFLYKLNKE